MADIPARELNDRTVKFGTTADYERRINEVARARRKTKSELLREIVEPAIEKLWQRHCQSANAA